MIKALITGGCGFIGSNFIRCILRARQDVGVINIDKLTYAGNLANLDDVGATFPNRYKFIKGDIADKKLLQELFGEQEHDIDWVINFAAESHVDRSILEPEAFIKTNIMGTFNLLESARQFWPLDSDTLEKEKRFLHISTDEVYGSLGENGYFTEETPYDPSSPYSASKAASDHLVNAYYRTYTLPAIITNCSNNYGPYQFPEKLIPLMIQNALKGLELPVYGEGENVRDWIFVEDHCKALLEVLEKGILGESYNIGVQCEMKNKDVVTMICDLLDEKLGLLDGQPRKGLIKFVADRPGHDLRYAIDSAKIRREIGWAPETSFDEGIKLTIDWYLDHTKWVDDILDGSYMGYYNKQYGERLRGKEQKT